MPISRAKKVELVDLFKEKIDSSEAVIMTMYHGLTVAEMEKLRRNLRANDASFVIAKKTLMSRALTDSGKPVPEEAMVGPVGFTFLGDDLSAGAKVLKDFSKEVGERFEVLGGILGDSILDAASATALADLPSRDVQLAQLIATIIAPMTSIASLITAPQRDLVGLLQARIDKEGGEEAEVDEVTEVAEAA